MKKKSIYLILFHAVKRRQQIIKNEQMIKQHNMQLSNTVFTIYVAGDVL